MSCSSKLEELPSGRKVHKCNKNVFLLHFRRSQEPEAHKPVHKKDNSLKCQRHCAWTEDEEHHRMQSPRSLEPRPRPLSPSSLKGWLLHRFRRMQAQPSSRVSLTPNNDFLPWRCSFKSHRRSLTVCSSQGRKNSTPCISGACFYVFPVLSDNERILPQFRWPQDRTSSSSETGAPRALAKNFELKVRFQVTGLLPAATERHCLVS